MPELSWYLHQTRPALTKEEEQILALRKDLDAQHVFVEANLRLVVYLAQKYTSVSPRHVSFFDLIQAGNLGLLRATYTFDVSQGCRFSTYAAFWIRKTILQEIGPRRHKTSTHPQSQESNTIQEISLEACEEVAASSPDEETIIRHLTLREALTTLDEEQRLLLSLRYEKGLTYRAIGEQLGYTDEWVRKKERATLRQMRRIMDPEEAFLQHTSSLNQASHRCLPEEE